jgi:hypothetical protein
MGEFHWPELTFNFSFMFSWYFFHVQYSVSNRQVKTGLIINYRHTDEAIWNPSRDYSFKCNEGNTYYGGKEESSPVHNLWSSLSPVFQTACLSRPKRVCAHKIEKLARKEAISHW